MSRAISRRPTRVEEQRYCVLSDLLCPVMALHNGYCADKALDKRLHNEQRLCQSFVQVARLVRYLMRTINITRLVSLPSLSLISSPHHLPSAQTHSSHTYISTPSTSPTNSPPPTQNNGQCLLPPHPPPPPRPPVPEKHPPLRLGR